MGLMRRDGSIPPKEIRKYMQISHIVALLEPLLADLIRRRPVVRLLDVACGSSYLTLLLGWCFKHRWHHPVEVMGVERRAKLVRASKKRLELAAVDDVVRIVEGSIRRTDIAETWTVEFGSKPPIDGLFALHACDTATCEAIASGVSLEAELIAVVPCCHAQLAASWSKLAAAPPDSRPRSELDSGAPSPFAPVWASPHLRREAAASMTDALRTLLLRGCGYTVTPMEFVPSTHTPKNTMLRATKNSEPPEPTSGELDQADPDRLDWSDETHPFAEYLRLRDALGGCPIELERLLPSPHSTTFRRVAGFG
jgi:hypothetical protein